MFAAGAAQLHISHLYYSYYYSYYLNLTFVIERNYAKNLIKL